MNFVFWNVHLVLEVDMIHMRIDMQSREPNIPHTHTKFNGTLGNNVFSQPQQLIEAFIKFSWFFPLFPRAFGQRVEIELRYSSMG